MVVASDQHYDIGGETTVVILYTYILLFDLFECVYFRLVFVPCIVFVVCLFYELMFRTVSSCFVFFVFIGVCGVVVCLSGKSSTRR